MKTSFLDYYKVILQKVSFDRKLFKKEYRKAIETLQESEAGILKRWIRENNINSPGAVKSKTMQLKGQN